MPTTHLTRAGAWALCGRPEVCELKFHFPDVTPEQMALVPEAILWDMCEIVDPPDHVGALAGRTWHNAAGKWHREYGLPARIGSRGSADWYVNGQLVRRLNPPPPVQRPVGLRPAGGGPPALDTVDLRRYIGRYDDHASHASGRLGCVPGAGALQAALPLP